MSQIDADFCGWLRDLLARQPDVRSVDPVTGDPESLEVTTPNGQTFRVCYEW